MKNLSILILVCIQLLISTAWAERIIIKVNLYEMSFQIEGQDPNAPLILKAGQDYKLIFENLGKMKHEILIGRGLVDSESNEYLENLFSNFKLVVTGSVMKDEEKRIWIVETNGMNEIELDPGLRLALYFNLPESTKGDWELGCFMPGHYQMGMKRPIIVQ